jgi:peptidoglycan-N-acetylglucosamine deacetylase
MGVQDIDAQLSFTRRTEAEMKRISLVIILCVSLTLAGSLTLIVAVSHSGSTSNVSHYPRVLRSKPHVSNHHKGKETTPVTPVPTATSIARPITPFPDQLWQQMAVLQEYNRFLYSGNPQKPEIALTFDDGPNPGYTPQVLATLEQYHVKATFFCVGRLVAQYPDLVKAEYADGDVIGNHSWSHANLGLLSSADIATQLRRTSDIIQQTLGVPPTFFRPPYGVFNTTVLTQANLMGLTTIIWNDEAHDWLRPGIDVISSRILGLAGNGAIILLHDGGGNRYQTVKALPTIITTLRAKGYNFVTLQQMVNDLPKHPVASHMPISISAPINVVTPTLMDTPIPMPTPDASADAKQIL